LPALLTSLLGLILVGLLAGGVATAQADCGGVQSAQPSKRPRTYLPPLAIGDSTMIFALPSLAAEGFDANARGCRQLPEAIALLTRLRHVHSLPHLVVLALGTNGSVTDADVTQVLAVLGHSRQLVLVTPREAGGGSGSDAATDRAEARRYPDRVHVLDWVSYSAGHASWFQPDRLHLTFAGAAAFARLLARSLALAPPPGHEPTGKPGPAPTSPSPPAKPSPKSCPTRAPMSLPPPAGLDQANPLVTLSASSPGAGGVLQAGPGSRTVDVALVNHNPFALVGTIGLAESSAAPSPAVASPLTCFGLSPDASRTVHVDLGAALQKLLGLKQRLAVEVTLRLFDQAGDTATVTGVYLLERPPRA
jgi:hypothetical protein